MMEVHKNDGCGFWNSTETVLIDEDTIPLTVDALAGVDYGDVLKILMHRITSLEAEIEYMREIARGDDQ